MMEKQEAQDLCQKVLRRCRQAQAEVLLVAEDSHLTRFANNTIHQNVAEHNLSLIVRYILDGKVGSAATNRSDAAGMDQLVQLARQNALASPPDLNFPGLAEPAVYAEAGGYDDRTATYPADERADAVGVVCRLAAKKSLNASGAFSTGARQVTVANTAGVFACHAGTIADFQVTVMGSDSSGRAQASAWRAGEIPSEARVSSPHQAHPCSFVRSIVRLPAPRGPLPHGSLEPHFLPPPPPGGSSSLASPLSGPVDGLLRPTALAAALPGSDARLLSRMVVSKSAPGLGWARQSSSGPTGAAPSSA